MKRGPKSVGPDHVTLTRESDNDPDYVVFKIRMPLNALPSNIPIKHGFMYPDSSICGLANGSKSGRDSNLPDESLSLMLLKLAYIVAMREKGLES